MEESAVAEHGLNGSVETAVRTVQGMARPIKDGLGKQLEMLIKRTSCIAPCLIRHAAASLMRFQVGKDGRTPYERLKRKIFRTKVC